MMQKSNMMNVEEFQKLLKPVTEFVAHRAINAELAEELNSHFPPAGATFQAVEHACHEAIAAGWMCAHGGDGRRYGRVIEPSEQTGGLSVDVVDLTDIVGPHHRHPTGEVCMVMPISENALFDGRGKGWCVYEPGSAHQPTVTDGEALVLYMLPQGKIEFS